MKADRKQHTPGPWRAIIDPCPTTRNRWLVEKRMNGWKTFICEVHGDPEHPGGKDWQGTREGNARLIAAAPDMLAALQMMPAVLDAPELRFELNAVLAAIAKATSQDV